MSGPKAIRVVSREERVARCNTLLAQFDAQASEWLRIGEELELLSKEDRAGTEQKNALLRQLLAANEFDQVERHAVNAAEFLRQDIDERIARHVEKKRREKIVRRRLGIAAEQALIMIKAAGQEIDASVSTILESAARGSIGDPDEVERSIEHAISMLASLATSRSLTGDQRDLAKKLQGQAEVETVTKWVVANARFDDDRKSKVDWYIADLEVTEGSLIASQFSRRAEEIQLVSSSGKRRMLLDTLIIDLAAEVKNRRQKRNLYKKAIALKAVMEQSVEVRSQSAHECIRELLEDWDEVDAETAERLIEETNNAIKELEKERAARFRRSALLEAFSELGYEIREGLNTAWVKDKRIIVHKSGQVDHGVEVSGVAEEGMLQVRPVRFGVLGSSSDRQRDMDIETIWCSEFSSLQQVLRGKGGGIAIERAKAVGETPVKVVPIPKTSRRRNVETASRSKKLSRR